MPIFDFLYWSQERGDFLAEDGPLIPVEVNVPAVLEEWLVKNNIAIPQPVSGYALIDTGASISAIHEPILNQLGILPIDSIPISTPSGAGRSFIYPTKVSFPALGVVGYSLSRVVGSDLNWLTPDGRTVVMLLGRDLLRFFLLVYNGQRNTITLSF
jgi:hypothetical protein